MQRPETEDVRTGPGPGAMPVRGRELHATVRRLALQGAYAPPLFIALGLMMARLLAAARVLDMAEFARYSATLLVSSSFCMLGALGLQIMVQREMPALILRGQERRGMALLTQAIIVAIACAVVGLLAALLLPPAGDDRALERGTFAMGIVHGLSQQVFLLVTIESRSRGMTTAFAGQYLVRSVAVVACGLGVMHATGSGTWGAGTEAATTLLLSTLLLKGVAARAGIGVAASAALATRRMHTLCWRSAALLLGVYALSWCAQNADRWVAERSLAIQAFAVYAFAANAMTIASAVQMVANSSLFPRLATEFASSGRRAAFRTATRFSVAVAGAGIIASPIAFLAWRFLTERWFPQYAESVEIAPALVAVGVIRIADYWTGFLIVIGAERRLLLSTACSSALVCAAWGTLAHRAEAPTIGSIAWLALALAVGWLATVFYVARRESRG
jgi:O-antigen/teichoic acid export membrane protein